MASIGRSLARNGPAIVRNTRSALFFRDYCVTFGDRKEAGEKTKFSPSLNIELLLLVNSVTTEAVPQCGNNLTIEGIILH